MHSTTSILIGKARLSPAAGRRPTEIFIAKPHSKRRIFPRPPNVFRASPVDETRKRPPEKYEIGKPWSDLAGFCSFLAAMMLAMGAFAPGGVYAQQADVGSARGAASSATEYLTSRLVEGLTREKYLSWLKDDFVQGDANNDGKLEQQDVETHMVMRLAEGRQRSRMEAMRYDVDGDGAVTKEEIRLVLLYQYRRVGGRRTVSVPNDQPPEWVEKSISNEIQRWMALDTNKDGRSTYSEASNGYDITRLMEINSLPERTLLMLTLDKSGKRQITLSDYLAEGEASFRNADANADNVLSQQEVTEFKSAGKPLNAAKPDANAAIEETPRKTPAAEPIPGPESRVGCTMPPPSEKAKVILASGSSTSSLSNVALGSRKNTTFAGRVTVEPGEEPLYLVIVSRVSTIWQLDGAVDRVERIVLASKSGDDGGNGTTPLVGATGLPSERVSFLAKTDCLEYFNRAPSGDSFRTAAIVRKATGREPQVIALGTNKGIFSVPSGKIRQPSQSQRPPLQLNPRDKAEIPDSSEDPVSVVLRAGPSAFRDQMYRSYPEGITSFRPEAIIASAPAVPYDVLPNEAGLLQLFEMRAITQNDSGEYTILRKTRLPSDLYGGHSVTFLLPKGMPFPEGDLGHSCIMSEETGEGTGTGCRNR